MNQWYVIVGGQQQGPISLEELQRRIQGGTVRQPDLVWTEGWAQWVAAGSVPELFPPGPAVSGYFRAHRGGAILALGILGIAPCFICGIIAWVMANNDLREMAAGTMDRSGEQMTRAGKICGIIGTVLGCCGIGIWLLWFVFVLIMFGGMAAHAA